MISKKIDTFGEWPPFFSNDLKHGGVTSHVASEAFALEGIKVEYGWFPWNRALHLAQTGDWDAAIGWISTRIVAIWDWVVFQFSFQIRNKWFHYYNSRFMDLQCCLVEFFKFLRADLKHLTCLVDKRGFLGHNFSIHHGYNHPHQYQAFFKVLIIF